MFARLHHFARLKRVALSVYNTIGPDAAAFLNVHGENIEELTISICRIALGPAPVTIRTLRLPSLRKLSVAWNPFNWGDNLDNPFQQIWADADLPMLDRIEISSPFMDVAHIALFCKTFRRPGGNRVRRLEVPCRTLNGESFDHLSDAFPNLHTLTLSTIFLSNPDRSAPSDWDIESFDAEMAHREYPAWTLYDLEITPPTPLGMPANFARPSYEAMCIAASHIPSVRSFSGRGHMDVLQ
ncbi:hypothetical protein EYR38_003497 [Pleurotus pulmonarius]|nr:hypothetical protein EYR38_003497 [Pleurotus pulmonarius]